LGDSGVTTKLHLLKILSVSGFVALSGCGIAQPAPPSTADNVRNQPAMARAKPSLVGILWKMATTEKEARPEKILPYFGINDIPPVKMVREDHGWFAITHQPPRFVNVALQTFGVASLYYGYYRYPSPVRERDYYSIQLVYNAHCISAEEVIAVFGQTFKRLPARVSTAAVAVPSIQPATPSLPAAVEKGSLHFETDLFDGRSSVTFEFDSKPCAQDILINYTRKNQ
jgi:hypothetical protein